MPRVTKPMGSGRSTKCILEDEDYAQLENLLFPYTAGQIKACIETTRTLSKFTIPQLKVIANYLRDARMMNISTAGRKDNVVGNIENSIYLGQNEALNERHARRDIATIAQQQIVLPPNQTLLSRPNIVQRLVPSAYNPPYPTPSKINSSRYQPINQERDKSDDERHLFRVVEQDMRMNNVVDCFSAPLMVLDVKSLKLMGGRASFKFEVKQSVYNMLTVPGEHNYRVELHLLTDVLKPKNYQQDNIVLVNNLRCEMPKKNNKLVKKQGAPVPKKDLLISSTPLILDKKYFTTSGWAEVAITSSSMAGMHGQLSLDGYIVILLCRVRSNEELIEIVKSRSMAPKTNIAPQFQKNMLDMDSPKDEPNKVAPINTKKKADDDDDDIIVDSAEVISFRDQVSMDRIELPTRGKHCVHKSVFDLATFLQFGGSSHVWNCSFCDRPLPFDDLMIDPNIHDILNKVDESVDKIILHPDGTFESEQNMKTNVKGEVGKTAAPVKTPVVEDVARSITPPLFTFEHLLNNSDDVGNLSPPLILTNSEEQAATQGASVDDAIEID